jgi:alkanesulfonate monooxygenase SsuD/methylene tetrahydromethanopterin reductase-like flavin-dependent oxidoreductase (luciferase family)
MAATIDQMSGGRLDLGIGTGWMDLEHEAFGLPFPPWAERFARLEEALRYLEFAFGEGDGSFEGTYYRIDAEAHPKPGGPMPIIIGGSGPKKTPALAGRFAAEYNHFLGPDDRMQARRTAMREAAVAAGRDPDSIVYSAVDHVITGDTEADYRDRLAAMAAARDTDVDAFAAMLDERGVLHGPADRVGERIAHLETLGISKFYLQFFDLPAIEDIETVWRAVQG